MGNRTHRGAIARLLVDSASTVKASVISQPSVETGPSPHPRRRGPNQAFCPISGEVRTLHYRARLLGIEWVGDPQRIPVNSRPSEREGGRFTDRSAHGLASANRVPMAAELGDRKYRRAGGYRRRPRDLYS